MESTTVTAIIIVIVITALILSLDYFWSYAQNRHYQREMHEADEIYRALRLLSHREEMNRQRLRGAENEEKAVEANPESAKEAPPETKPITRDLRDY